MTNRVTRRTLLGLAAMALSAICGAQPSRGADTTYRMVIMLGGGAPGVKVEWIGPITPSVDKPIEMIDSIIPTKPDLIAVAANDPRAIVPVLKKAKAAGIHVMSFDGDTDFREAFRNLVDYQAMGAAL